MNRFGLFSLLFFLFFCGDLSLCGRPKSILLYTPPQDKPNSLNWHTNDGFSTPEDYLEKNCPATNCLITANRMSLPDTKHYDVIVLNAGNAPPIADFTPSQIRHKEQIYVMYFRESSNRTRNVLTPYSHMVNWTMGYPLRSDIVSAYGEFFDKETKMKVSPSLQPDWRAPNFEGKILKDPKVRQIVGEKSKLAAWFVSSCKSPSQRKLIVKKMQHYAPVDVFGNCGKLECRKKDRSCRDTVERDYKFYLSFENSLCADYVTEKVFSWMQRYIVPVVYGGADYNRFLPPHSYINVLDYDSVEDLVEYMKFLSENPQEYMKYFWWKDFYDVGGINLCGLCEKITKLGQNGAPSSHNYTDLESWFKNGTCTEVRSLPLLGNLLEEFRGQKISFL